MAAGVLGGAVLAAADPFSGGDNPWPYASAGRSPVLAAVGAVSCQPSAPVEGEKQKDVCDKTGSGYTTRWQAQTATANQIEGMQPNLVAVLGDEQYEVGRYQDFMGSFDHTYGAFKFLQRPAPGNHEFYDEHGTGAYYGVMKLTLNRDSYAWDFESAPNAPNPGSATYSDTGSARCHGPAGDGS